SARGAAVHPKMGRRNVAHNEVEALERVSATSRRNRRKRAIGDLHHRPANRNEFKQPVHQIDALVDWEVEHGDCGYDAVESTALPRRNHGLEIESTAMDEVYARKVSRQAFNKITGIFDGDEIFRLHAPLQNGPCYGAGARP